MDTSTILTIVLFCVGAVQGIVFGFILLNSKKQNKLANRLLATILFFLSYRLIVQVMRLLDLGYYDSLYYIMLDLSWVNGALLYFYVKAQVLPDFKFKRENWVHFLPLLIQLVCSIFVRMQNLYWDGTRESLSWLGYWGYAAWMNYSTIYITASSLIIFYSIKSEKLLNNAIDKTILLPERILWIKRIIISFKFYFILVLVVLIVDLAIYNITSPNSYFYYQRFYYYPFFGGIAVLTYWIGIEGFKRKDQHGLIIKTELSEIERARLEEIAVLLKKVMKEKKLFKNPELSLNTLANDLEIKPYLLSKCLNEILNKKFSDYINEIRVEEVKDLIKNPENDKYTLLAIALDAGFNSKSSFNRAVKKQMGISPNELKRNI